MADDEAERKVAKTLRQLKALKLYIVYNNLWEKG